MKDAIFLYTDAFMNYKFHDKHPFNHTRVKLTYDLLKESNHLHDHQVFAPRIALDEELALFHNESFINVVNTASKGVPVSSIDTFGIGTDDTPTFANMHEASAQIVGATLHATELVMEGKTKAAFNVAGGLHHSMREKAAGFCIYNDAAVAIEYIRKHYPGTKVLYVDTDAHHGDGVQWGFYDCNDVCTLSIHETGKYLFPGTGSVSERGYGEGLGFSFNLPLEAFTEDDSFLSVYETALNKVADYFKPDVIITQNGADAHYHDPLTHLMTTMRTYHHIPKVAKKVAQKHCQGKWIALGGGGYDLWRVVPRAWAAVWHAMVGIDLSENEQIPQSWLSKWQLHAPVTLPKMWGDKAVPYEPIPRKPEIEKANEHALKRMLVNI
jgi:acetoin utilization protein AcuC